MFQKIYIGVLGCPIRRNDQNQIEYFLTQRYAPGKPDVHHKWQLAGGGLEFGESPEKTLVREFQEELSVTPQILYSYPIIRTVTYDNPNHGVHIVLVNYIISIGDQKPKNTDPDHETSDMGWFTFEQIEKLDNLENNLYFIKEVRKIADKENLV